MDVTDIDRLFHQPCGGYRCKPASDEFFGEGAHGVLAGGDGAVLTAVLNGAGVEIADRCAADGATVFYLLVHACDDFVSDVAGVELDDAAHDAVEEDARLGFGRCSRWWRGAGCRVR